MLKKIIKRSGEIEDFEPSKLNKWSRWASADLGDRVDWSSIVLHTVKAVGETIGSQELQKQLIKNCLQTKNWAYNLMAGKLYAALYRKELYNDEIPTVKQQHENMFKLGYMVQLNYTDEEYKEIESFIDHDRDYKLAHFQIHQLRKKYSLNDKIKKKEYETPQFIFMRMAMALAEDEQIDKLLHVKNWYDHFSYGRINAPTPNYVNLGTKHNGYASCCLYTTDDTAASLAIGDHIAYTMTYMSSGIGGYIGSRSLGNPVRDGIIEHQGKLPYYRSLAAAVKANLQGGRGGACTTYFSCYDPEANTIIMLQNPRTTKDKQNRDIHFAFMYNRLFAKKVAKNEDIFTFNKFTHPDLHELFFSDKQDEFEELYAKYETDPMFNKNYVSARQLVISAMQQSHEVATLYFLQIDEVNRHTSYLEPIYSSNLCIEITQPTSPYQSMVDLYTDGDVESGEVSLCSLAGIVVSNIKDDSTYESACYYALKMIDKCIHMSDYVLPHVGYTAKNRLNAGVGMIGLATSLAKKNFRYDEDLGRKEIHHISERHAYYVIKASLQLGKELGNAPWIHKTKWPKGWLPIDTYKKNVDKIVSPEYKYDWETLRSEIIANQGIRNSSLIAHMPTESSSKASGAPNGVYPIRELSLKKTDLKNTIDWCAPDNDIYGDQYQVAWEISTEDMVKVYAIIQKFTDQSISADFYRDRSVKTELTTTELIKDFLDMVTYGVKSKYYQNSFTLDAVGLEDHLVNEKAECVGGCTL